MVDWRSRRSCASCGLREREGGEVSRAALVVRWRFCPWTWRFRPFRLIF